MNINNQDRIDNYLLNRMSDEERKAFEADVAKDTHLKEQMTFTKNVMNAIKSRNEKLAMIKEWQNDYVWKSETDEIDSAIESHISDRNNYNRPSIKDSQKAHYSSKKQILYWASGIAAVVIAGFFLFHNLYMTETKNEFSTLPMGITNLRAGSDYSDIELLLNQKKYEEALSLIEQETNSLRGDSVEIFQDLSIDLEKRDFKLQEVRMQQEDLKWLKIYALLGINNQHDAFRLLDEMRQEEGYYQMAADSLYNHLKK